MNSPFEPDGPIARGITNAIAVGIPFSVVSYMDKNYLGQNVIDGILNAQSTEEFTSVLKLTAFVNFMINFFVIDNTVDDDDETAYTLSKTSTSAILLGLAGLASSYRNKNRLINAGVYALTGGVLTSAMIVAKVI